MPYKCTTCAGFLFGCPDCECFAAIAAAIRNTKQNGQDNIADSALNELSRIMDKNLVFCATGSAGKLEYSIIESQFED